MARSRPSERASRPARKRRKTGPAAAAPEPAAAEVVLLATAAKPKKRRRRAGGRKTIVVLSRKRTLYSTRRLVEAGQALGHRVRVIDTLRCSMVLKPNAPMVHYRDKPLDDVDVVVPRIGASITHYGLAVVNQFDMMGVPVLNNSVPIARSRDKLRCLQLLARFGLDIPRTAMVRKPSEIGLALDGIGGLPAVIKLIQGTQGVGVMIAHSHEEIESILDTMWDLQQDILIQEFVAESAGRDVRALVVGDEVVGAMRRQSPSGDFRSNLHRGGEGEPVDLPDAYRLAAIQAARVIGLEIAGVDLLESRGGPKILEINSSPGFEGLERATGLPVAEKMIAHAVRFAEARALGYAKQRLI